jgi:hypothetical protein
MNTLIQLQAPNGLRGRVFSTYLWALQGASTFGSLLIGSMVQAWGLPVTALVSGGICALAVGGIHLRIPSLRLTEA